jgi:type IV fimbrial biogenesis protein FimT
LSNPTHHVSSATPRPKAGRGFTLVELMITITVAMVLVAIAAPSFDAVFNSGRIDGAANELVATLQVARMEAIRRNAHVVVCASANGTSCTNAVAWTGWLAFVDDGGYSHSHAAGVAANAGNGAVDANEPILRVNTINTPVQVQTSTNISGTTHGAITFNSDGMARDVAGNLLDGTISVCLAKAHPEENVRNVSIKSGSRVLVNRASGGGACAVPANTLP